MDFRIAPYLKSLDRATGLEDLQRCTEELRDQLGVAHTVYHWVSADGEQYGCGTYDRSWVQRYVDRNYIRIDPVVLGCFQRFNPTNWKSLDWSSKAARAFLADAVAHGVGTQGFSIPIRGPNGQFALFSISDTQSDADWRVFTEEHQRDLIVVAHYLNQKALDIARRRTPMAQRPLSKREVDTLTYLAMGYSRAQVAEILTISEHTLRAYIESARFKLNAENTIHAVCMAMAEGHIIVGGGGARR